MDMKQLLLDELTEILAMAMARVLKQHEGVAIEKNDILYLVVNRQDTDGVFRISVIIADQDHIDAGLKHGSLFYEHPTQEEADRANKLEAQGIRTIPGQEIH